MTQRTLIATMVPHTVVTTVCSEDQYRYGNNGQMKVNEIAGVGNHYTAKFWDMDPRVGRRWNQDPVVDPGISRYAVFGNNPVLNSDPDGDILRIEGSPAFVRSIEKVFDWLQKHGLGEPVEKLKWSPYVYVITPTYDFNGYFESFKKTDPQGKYDGFYGPESSCGGGVISWNPYYISISNTGYIKSPAEILAHEVAHAAGNAISPPAFDILARELDRQYDKTEEKRVITGFEQQLARALGKIHGNEKTREDHESKGGYLGNGTDPFSTDQGIGDSWLSKLINNSNNSNSKNNKRMNDSNKTSSKSGDQIGSKKEESEGSDNSRYTGPQPKSFTEQAIHGAN